MTKTLKVTLEAKPNPDASHKEHRGTVNIKETKKDIPNLRAASAHCQEFIQTNGLGAGNWTGGKVLEDGKQIAHVSYNGRVWWGKGKAPNISEEVLFFKAFPHIAIPKCLSYGEGADKWSDESWKNDAAPRMSFPFDDYHTIEVWVYSPFQEHREGNFDHRYSVCVYNDNGDLIGKPINCDTEDRLIAAVKEKYNTLSMILSDIARREGL
jgi:hypothetical protein